MEYAWDLSSNISNKTCTYVPEEIRHVSQPDCGLQKPYVYILREIQYKFKNWRLNCVLEFTVPDDRCIIDIDDYAIMRHTICHISQIIGIHIIFDHNILTKGLQHATWNNLLSIRVKVFPLTQIYYNNPKQITISQLTHRVVCHPPLGYYPSSLNTWIYDRHHQYVPLLGEKSNEIKKLLL